MSWSNYLRSILEQETVLDDLAISLDGEYFKVIPSILKASILLTDKLLDSGRRNMVVFPEQQTCSFAFMLLRTLYNIAEGRINKDYDPSSFIPGEKLKLKNSVVEFVGIETDIKNGAKRIFVRTKDMQKYGILLETAPFLQHVETKLLSKTAAFSKEYHKFLKDNASNSSRAFIQQLSDYKTHLDSASVFVAPILSSKKLLLNTLLNNERISDSLLLAQSDIEGNIKNLTTGQLAGTPAIVLCQDLYTVCASIECGLAADAVFIEANQTTIDNQLDALDDLIAKDKSIVLMTDQANFTDFSHLESRGFSIWTWNENTITADVYKGTSRLDVRVKNSGIKKVRYIDVLCPEISNSLSLLYKNKKLIEDQSAATIQIFQDLFEITLIVLRAVSPLTNTTRVFEILERCKSTLEQEKGYLRRELFEELNTVTDNLELIYTSSSILPKVSTLTEVLKNADNDTAYIIVPQNVNKDEVVSSLKTAGIGDGINLIVAYPREYPQSAESSNGLTLVSGWLNRNTMNKILNANITPEIITLVYETEKRWKNEYARSNTEQSKRNNTMNASILASIEGSLADDLEEILGSVVSGVYGKDDDYFDSGELDEIELILKQNKYRRYISSMGADSVSAVPVSFAGDLIAFYRTGRTILTVTKLINEDYDKIEEVKPTEILTGDLIIEREAQRDLIRDIADMILENSNCLELRAKAHKWKEALEVESVFYDEDTIYKKLLKAGCTRGKMTVHNWLTNDGMITPQSKDDIIHIANATDDSVLLEMVEQVFDAGKIIKRAHIQAGHYLAEKLRANLAGALPEKGSIDGFNVWQPLEIEIENMGLVKLLKVIDVGSEVLVDAAITNRLIDTNRMVGGGENSKNDSVCYLAGSKE